MGAEVVCLFRVSEAEPGNLRAREFLQTELAQTKRDSEVSADGEVGDMWVRVAD